MCVYTGGAEEHDLAKALAEKLPGYMMPNRYVHLDRLPMTINDKIDRVTLRREHIG